MLYIADFKQAMARTGTKARKAAQAVAGLLAIPQLRNTATVPTDSKDLAHPEGVGEVKRQIDNAQPVQLSTQDIAVAIAGLTALGPIDYDRVRQQEAKRLGLRVATLDEEVDKARAGVSDDSAQGTAVRFEDVEPWPNAVGGAVLLDDLAASARRHIVLPGHGDTVLALWTLFTYFIDAATTAPILAIRSPEKRCGKTTVLSWLGRLVHRAILASNLTPAAVFRVIEHWRPTLLIDEADTFIASSDELRGVLNSGHTRDTAWVVRNVGESHEPRQFSTWGAKAIALIGELPGTLGDRSITIEMRRKFLVEKVKKLRHADKEETKSLSRRCLRFANDHTAAVRAARPQVPETLNDRAADNWEPLLAIADLAGGDWPERARVAAQALSTSQQTDDSFGVLLLADIRQVFADKRTERLATGDLLKALWTMEERPWPAFAHGKPLTAAQLARLVRQFDIHSRTIRIGQETPKGYSLDRFADAFARYLPVFVPPQHHNAAAQGDGHDAAIPTASARGGSGSCETGSENRPCGAVADKNLQSRTEEAGQNWKMLEGTCEG